MIENHKADINVHKLFVLTIVFNNLHLHGVGLPSQTIFCFKETHVVRRIDVQVPRQLTCPPRHCLTVRNRHTFRSKVPDILIKNFAPQFTHNQNIIVN